MPGFTIHLAIANEYAKKNKEKVKNMNEFLEGTIAPDYIFLTNQDISKNITHYGKWGDWTTNDQEIYFDKFLEDKKVDLQTDYWKGYFLHLLADYYFGKKYFYEEMKKAKENNDKFYNDYDCTNKELIEKYNIKIIDKIKKYMSCIEEKPKYLKIDKVNKFIENMANLNLEEQVDIIKKYGTKQLVKK